MRRFVSLLVLLAALLPLIAASGCVGLSNGPCQASGQCSYGCGACFDTVVTTPASFPSGCSSVDGSLTISGVTGADLSFLNSLTSVTGNLTLLNNNVAHIYLLGLQQAQHVSVEGNTGAVQFPLLTTTGTFRFVRNVGAGTSLQLNVFQYAEEVLIEGNVLTSLVYDSSGFNASTKYLLLKDNTVTGSFDLTAFTSVRMTAAGGVGLTISGNTFNSDMTFYRLATVPALTIANNHGSKIVFGIMRNVEKAFVIKSNTLTNGLNMATDAVPGTSIGTDLRIEDNTVGEIVLSTFQQIVNGDVLILNNRITNQLVLKDLLTFRSARIEGNSGVAGVIALWDFLGSTGNWTITDNSLRALQVTKATPPPANTPVSIAGGLTFSKNKFTEQVLFGGLKNLNSGDVIVTDNVLLQLDFVTLERLNAFVYQNNTVANSFQCPNLLNSTDATFINNRGYGIGFASASSTSWAISGHFYIQNNVFSNDVLLANVGSVAGDIIVTGNTMGQLGFTGLKSFGTIVYTNNNHTTFLMQNAQRGHSIIFKDNVRGGIGIGTSVLDLTGDILISNNTVPASGDLDLQGVRSIGGLLSVTDSIAHQLNIAALESVGTLLIKRNTVNSLDANKLKAVTGNFIIEDCVIITQVSFSYPGSGDVTIGGDLSMQRNVAGDSFYIEAPGIISGSFTVKDNTGKQNTWSHLKSVGGVVDIQNNKFTDLYLQGLTSVPGDLFLKNNKVSGQTALNVLGSVGGSLFISGHEGQNVQFAALDEIDGSLYVQNNKVGALALLGSNPSLAAIGGSAIITGNTVYGNFQLNSLGRLSLGKVIFQNNYAAHLSFVNLRYAQGLLFENNTGSDCSFNALEYVNGTLSIVNDRWDTFWISSTASGNVWVADLLLFKGNVFSTQFYSPALGQVTNGSAVIENNTFKEFQADYFRSCNYLTIRNNRGVAFNLNGLVFVSYAVSVTGNNINTLNLDGLGVNQMWAGEGFVVQDNIASTQLSLRSLDHVQTGSVVIQRNTAKLLLLDSFRGAVDLIFQNNVGESFTMNSLAYLDGVFLLTNNKIDSIAINSPHNDAWIQNHLLVENNTCVSGMTFNALYQVKTGNLDIKNNFFGGSTGLSFASFGGVDDLTITGNTGTVFALQYLRYVENIVVTDNVLSNIDINALPGTINAGSALIQNNVFRAVCILHSFRQFQALTIVNNTTPGFDFYSLQNVVDDLLYQDNCGSANLNMATLQYAENLVIRGNPSLTAIDPGALKQLNSITIQDNIGVISIIFNVMTSTNVLTIVNNPALTSINAWQAWSVGAINIQNNPQLCATNFASVSYNQVTVTAFSGCNLCCQNVNAMLTKVPAAPTTTGCRTDCAGADNCGAAATCPTPPPFTPPPGRNCTAPVFVAPPAVAGTLPAAQPSPTATPAKTEPCWTCAPVVSSSSSTAAPAPVSSSAYSSSSSTAPAHSSTYPSSSAPSSSSSSSTAGVVSSTVVSSSVVSSSSSTAAAVLSSTYESSSGAPSSSVVSSSSSTAPAVSSSAAPSPSSTVAPVAESSTAVSEESSTAEEVVVVISSSSSSTAVFIPATDIPEIAIDGLRLRIKMPAGANSTEDVEKLFDDLLNCAGVNSSRIVLRVEKGTNAVYVDVLPPSAPGQPSAASVYATLITNLERNCAASLQQEQIEMVTGTKSPVKSDSAEPLYKSGLFIGLLVAVIAALCVGLAIGIWVRHSNNKKKRKGRYNTKGDSRRALRTNSLFSTRDSSSQDGRDSPNRQQQPQVHVHVHMAPALPGDGEEEDNLIDAAPHGDTAPKLSIEDA